MAETVYDRINDYGSVRIQLASPNDIRSWSFGEVKKPETINYRTYRAEKDGLFCERIFGPERDWECSCGKYKGTKYKGIICDRCGVKVTHSRVRRKRMGHINLAAPIVHIWFFKALPSRLGRDAGHEDQRHREDRLLPGLRRHRPRQDAAEEEAAPHRRRVPRRVREVRRRIRGRDGRRGDQEAARARSTCTPSRPEIRADIEKTNTKQKIKDLTKRLKMIEAIRGSENKAEWMVMDVIPVIPPDLRPLVLLESGNFATSDLNDLYRRIINRNNRLKKLVDLNAPEVIIRNEKRMLQQAVDALFDNGRCRRPVLGSSNRPLKSLTDMIKGKQGRFRENLLGKRVDYSARSVIVVGPELKLHQCGLPKKIALELYQPFIIRKLKEHGLADTIKSAKKMLERRDPEVWDILEEVHLPAPGAPEPRPDAPPHGHPGVRAGARRGQRDQDPPAGLQGLQRRLRRRPDGRPPAAVDRGADRGARADAGAEQHLLARPTAARSSRPSQDIVLGIYYITADREGDKGEFSIFNEPAGGDARLRAAARSAMHTRIFVRLPDRTHVVPDRQERRGPDRRRGVEDDRGAAQGAASRTTSPKPRPRSSTGQVILTTVGRCIFNDILPRAMPFYNCALTSAGQSRVIADCYAQLGRPATIKLLDDMKELGLQAVDAGRPVVRHHRHPHARHQDRRSSTKARRRPTTSRRTTAWAPSPTRSATPSSSTSGATPASRSPTT